MSIRVIVITDCKIIDAGLKHPAKMTKLNSLDLSDSEIRDEGLMQLRPPANLESLDLVGTKVTYDGIAAIQAGLPKLKTAEISRPNTPGNLGYHGSTLHHSARHPQRLCHNSEPDS